MAAEVVFRAFRQRAGLGTRLPGQVPAFIWL